MTFRPGARIGLDVGSVRIGVSRSDPGGILVLPVATITRRSSGEELERITGIIEEHAAIEVIVGLPLGLRGHEGSSAQAARKYAELLAGRIDIPVRLMDERLSSVSAHQQLHESGRKMVHHRTVVDQVAATVILEQALEQERRTGLPPGELVRKEL